MSEGEKSQPLPEGRGDFSNLRALGAISLAGLSYILLLDAAFETFWSGSSVWWWVAIVVAAYLGGSAALWWQSHPLWHRLEWATKASLSFFVLLGLLAFTVWLPGGLTYGLKVFGLSTSTLLVVVTAVAIAFSGMILMRPSYPHPAIKWAIGALATYAVIAFLLAVIAGVPYPDLFHGYSFWNKLPWWLQGAFIGAFILVPAALFFQIVKVLQRTSSIDLQKWGLAILGLAMSLIIAVAGLVTLASSARNQIQFDLPSGARLGPIIFARGESRAQPVGQADRFQEGIKAVYAFFNLEGLKSDDTVIGVWYKGSGQLREQRAKVSELPGANTREKGYVWLINKFENGAPPGGYFLEISVNENLALAASFAVNPK